MLQKFGSFLILALFSPLVAVVAQPSGRSLRQREAPCQVQYSQAVGAIGLARWSAPEEERASIERLLNAAAKAKELVDASFVQYEPSLCSSETLARLHASVDRLQNSGWLPSTAEQRRTAEAAAANAELLKAIDAGLDDPRTPATVSGSPRVDSFNGRRASE